MGPPRARLARARRAPPTREVRIEMRARSAAVVALVVGVGCGRAGSVTTLAGSTEPGFADGVGADARFQSPTGLAVTPEGVLYVADATVNAIRRVGPDGV